MSTFRNVACYSLLSLYIINGPRRRWWRNLFNAKTTAADSFPNVLYIRSLFAELLPAYWDETIFHLSFVCINTASNSWCDASVWTKNILSTSRIANVGSLLYEYSN